MFIHSSDNLTFPQIERDQTRRQLEYLGYESGQNVYLRFFYHSLDERKGNDKGRKLNRLRWEAVENYQRDGRGVYVVVNGTGGGHEDKDIKQCVAIFCEWDERSLEEQLLHWETLGFLEPTFTVYSGDKSAQPYWVFDQPITVEQWRELQLLLIEVMGADPANQNPSRVFRLAGGWHIKPGREPVRTEIVQDSGVKYSYETIQAELLRLKTQQPQQTLDSEIPVAPLPQVQTPNHTLKLDSFRSHNQGGRYEDITVPVPECVPLKACLSKESRALLDWGANLGGRNTNGAKLARDLIGTAAYLQSIGQLFEGDPRPLLSDYAARCTPPLPIKEVDAIWKSALKDNPTPSCPPTGVETCIRSWYWRNYVRPNQRMTTDRKGTPGFPSSQKSSEGTQSVTRDNSIASDSSNTGWLDVSATVTAVTAILSKGLEEWLEQAELDAVLTQSVMSRPSFWQLVASQRSQFDEVLPQDKQRLDQLIDWDNTQLNFHNVLPHMASDLVHDAQILNVDPVGIWQYLFPAVLSLLGKQVNLNVDSHIIPAIAWTCSVMESGGGKTRAKKLVTSSLEKWQEAETRRFQEEYVQFKEKISASKKDNAGEKPDPPTSERKYLFKIATMQALMRRLSEQGNNGSLLVRDEIGGWFKSLDQFSGKGETEGLDVFIESWDGDTQQVDRVHYEDSFIVSNPRLSLAGGIQPGMFRKIFKDPEDAQGLQARMLFACLKVMPAKRVKGYCHLSQTLPKLFKWIDEQFPKATLKLSPAASALYDKIYESIGIQAELGATPAVRIWMRKLSSQILRIALALHTIECFYEPNRPRHEIQRDTLERAIEMGRYYRSAFQVVQEKTADSDSISSILMKIWDLGIANPTGILARDAYRAVKAIGRRAKDMGRQVGAYTLELFGKLQEMGRGFVEKDGRQFRFVVKLPEPPPDGDGNNGDGGGGNPPVGPMPPDNDTQGIEEMVTAVTVPQTSIDQELQVSQKELVSRVTEQSESSLLHSAPSSTHLNTTSDDLSWLMSLLADLESQPQPHKRFTSVDQLIELFGLAEQKGSRCQEELNQCCPDYWERACNRLGKLSEVLLTKEVPSVAGLEEQSASDALSKMELTQTDNIKLPENKGVGEAPLSTPAQSEEESATIACVNSKEPARAFVLEQAKQCCNILDVERLGYERLKAGISNDVVTWALNQLDERTKSRIKRLKRQLKKHIASLRNGLSVQVLDGFYGTICAKSADGRFLVQGQRDRKTGTHEARYYFGAELKPMGTSG